MRKILITGSRDADFAMLRLTDAWVNRCYERKHKVIVGDALGVDLRVIRLSNDLDMPITVYGAYGRMRIRTLVGENIPLACQSYLVRDQVMARECDLCIAIWNGESRGTLYTAQYAQHIGKSVIWPYRRPAPGQFHPMLKSLGA